MVIIHHITGKTKKELIKMKKEKKFWDTAKLPWMNFSDSAKNA